MIELHRYKTDQFADEIEQKLDNLVVAYRSEYYDENEKQSMPLPFIKESGKIIQGSGDIKEYLAELEKELTWQRSLSGDGCYIDPDSGKVC